MVTINTGDDRNVTAHFLSGLAFSAMFAGANNYDRLKKEEITKDEMIKDTTKLAIQGGVGTASAIAATNYIGSNNYIGALTALSLGAMGIYGTQKISEMYDRPMMKTDKEEK